MRRAKVRTSAAAAVLVAAALLLSGCGGDGEAEAEGKKSPPTGARPSPSSDKPGKMVPESELTPGTGSFSKKQKEYLVNRVPEGLEPVAVLEAGEEACYKIKGIADSDRKAAAKAISEGEISNAEAAVKHLCPEYEDLL